MNRTSRKKAGVFSLLGSSFIALSFFFKEYVGIFWILTVIVLFTALFFALQGLEGTRKQARWLIVSVTVLLLTCAVVAGIIVVTKG